MGLSPATGGHRDLNVCRPGFSVFLFCAPSVLPDGKALDLTPSPSWFVMGLGELRNTGVTTVTGKEGRVIDPTEAQT